MPIEKVQPGQPMQIPASTYNAMVDAAQDFQGRQRGVGSDPLKSSRYEGTVRVRHSTGTAFDRFGVVGLGAMVISQEDNAQSFYSRPTFEAEAPIRTSALNYGRHVAKVAVVQEPIQSGAIGRACRLARSISSTITTTSRSSKTGTRPASRAGHPGRVERRSSGTRPGRLASSGVWLCWGTSAPSSPRCIA